MGGNGQSRVYSLTSGHILKQDGLILVQITQPKKIDCFTFTILQIVAESGKIIKITCSDI